LPGTHLSKSSEIWSDQALGKLRSRFLPQKSKWGAELEFKSTVCWDLREGKKNPELEAVIRYTVAGFLSANGGTLRIGVADDGSIVGLQPDYGTFKKPNQDGFELFLTELLLGGLGKDLATSFRTTFHEVDGKDVCRVTDRGTDGRAALGDGRGLGDQQGRGEGDARQYGKRR